ncbi:hypothetical protein [Myxosarcina sp. GI1]|uniref:hypothetical protein n=1 Tax=Myxosarcina sp. GI1 TaxID=1541065 RepID=UPI00055F8ADC|nr:hypothetical protein [Myxosarcina sp. GI1]
MDYSFSTIIQRVNLIASSKLNDEVKLRQAGELFYQSSLSILVRAEAAFEASLQPEIATADTKIDSSFSLFIDSLTQQSVSTIFLQKYLQPQVRAAYQRESLVTISTLTAVEAVEKYSLEKISSEVSSLAYDENINAWIDKVAECLRGNPQVNTLIQIVRATDLSVAQVFISLLFGNFELVPSENFYDGFKILARNIQ